MLTALSRWERDHEASYAQDIADGMVINLGMGMPVAVADIESDGIEAAPCDHRERLASGQAEAAPNSG
jgi:acyl CoA:acetate/3-ketoacid CoA transferase beta subunit